MIINQNFAFIHGAFETTEAKMVCVTNRKYLSVDLCLSSDGGCNIPIGSIKLSSTDAYDDISPIFDDMCRLGKEMARRWNECPLKK